MTDQKDVRQQILTFGGEPPLTAKQAARYLGLTTRQGLSRRRRANRLLGLPIGPRKFLYPRWQFDRAGQDQLLWGMVDFLEIASEDPWGLADILTTRQPYLFDLEPIAVLQDPARRAIGRDSVVAALRDVYDKEPREPTGNTRSSAQRG